MASDVTVGRFELERPIGAGGMGVVYRARDRHTGQVVALKMLERGDPRAAARFALEASVLADLDHPAIVKYVAHGEGEDGRPYLAMEWLDGSDLRERLLKGALEPREALAVGVRVAEALACAHARGVLHRDVKPSNIFLPGGRLEDARLIDFGLARLVGEASGLTRGGARLGTPAYMSPEQVRGEGQLDARTDVFGLGVVLFECLAGRPPHEGARAMAIMFKRLLEDAPRLASVRPDVPAALDDLVAALLQRERTFRPADAAEVAAALVAIREDRAPRAALAPTPGAAALTGEESRLVCVVLSVAPDTPRSAPEQATEADASGDDGSGSTASTASHSADDIALVDRIAELAMRHGARMEPLLNGSFASVLSTGTGAATDLSVRGARYALGLRELVTGSRLAMTVGAAVVSRPLALDTIIETVAQLAGDPGEGAPTGEAAAGIRIDATAAGLLGGRFEIRHDAQGAWLVGERTGDEGGRRLLGKRMPCVGRSTELRKLRAAIAKAIGGGGARAVLVTGPAGIGKSRVVAELLDGHDASAAPVWIGRADPLRQHTPFGVVVGALRAAAGIVAGATPVEARVRLAELAHPVAARERPRVLEFLGELCGLPVPADAGVELRAARHNPILLADQVQRAWEDLVLALTRVRPLVLVLEDLHFGDAPSLKLADAALRVARERPLVVIATARPEVLTQTPPPFAERAPLHLRLGELSRRAATRLVRAALGTSLPAAELEALAERGAGNALYLEELVRAAAAGARGELPGTVRAMAMARLEAESAEARRVLRAASVFGDSFYPGGVAELLGVRVAELAEPLARLCDREWLSLAAGPTPEETAGSESAAGVPVTATSLLHRFRHDVLREAAYAQLTDGDRRLGHRLAAAWLERRGERDAAALAMHHERGGERVRAGQAHRRAAEQALAASDLGGALAHAQDAARLGVRGEGLGEVRLCEAVAHHWRAAHDAEHRAALDALRLLPPLAASWYRAVEELAEASLPVGDVDTLLALADVLEEAPGALAGGETSKSAFRTAAATLTMQLALAGRREAAESVMARLEASLQGSGLPPPLVRARAEFARATLAMIAGDLGGVIERATAAVAAFDEAGDLRSAALMRTNLAWAYVEMGAWAEAEAPLRAAAAVAERMGLEFVLGGVKNNLGLVLARQGRLAEAVVVEGESADFYRRVGNARVEGMSRIYLALIHTAAGAHADGEREARAAVATLAQTPPMRAYALAALATVLLARGDGAAQAEATTVAREAMALLDELGAIDEGETLVRLVHAETLALAGEPAAEAARAAAARARDVVHARAEKIRDPGFRRSFLTQVPENARTLALAARLHA